MCGFQNVSENSEIKSVLIVFSICLLCELFCNELTVQVRMYSQFIKQISHNVLDLDPVKSKEILSALL